MMLGMGWRMKKSYKADRQMIAATSYLVILSCDYLPESCKAITG